MKITRTCSACPTQYSIVTDEGLYVYFRYRFARWQLQVYRSEAEFDFGGSQTLAQASGEYGEHPLDGDLTHGEVVALLEIHLPPLLIEAGASC